MLPLIDAVKAYEKHLKGLRIVRIMTVDPGVITGVSVIWFNADNGEIVMWAETLITHDELKQVMDLMALLRTLADRGRVYVVVEDFTVMMVNMDPDFLSPVRIGRQFAFGAWLMATGELGAGPVFGEIVMPVAYQSRSRKADYDDDRLRKLGFYTPGPDHRRDATRHGLVRWKQLKLELPLATANPAFDVWDPAVAAAPAKIQRNFNGVPTTPKGQRAVTKDDMQRIAVKQSRFSESVYPPTKEMVRMAETNGLMWVPLPEGKGFVLEHDPLTQSGIAPRSSEAVKKTEKPARNLVSAAKTETGSRARRRAPKRLI